MRYTLSTLLRLLREEWIVRVRFSAARQHQLAPIGGGQVHAHHLHRCERSRRRGDWRQVVQVFALLAIVNQCGAVEIYNAARPDDITGMPAKFAGLRVSRGDVMAFYGPCGGGYGDPLDRPAEKVLEDVLDDFCTVEHTKTAYGVVVNLDTETVDVAATEALRSRMRADPRRGVSCPARVDRRGDDVRRAPRAALATSTADRPAAAGSGKRRPAGPYGSGAPPPPPPPAVSSAGASSIEDLVVRLNERLGGDWSFDVQRHHRNGGGIEVRAELESNGTRVQRTGTSNGNGSLPLGAQIEIASQAAFRSCAEEMLEVANRGWRYPS